MIRSRIAAMPDFKQEVILEIAARCREPLRFYDPLPAARDFHTSTAPQRVVFGSNRAGKTQAAAVEFARLVCGVDPYHKLPDKDGVAMVVGLSEAHLSKPIHRYLFEGGAFNVIWDSRIHRWRPARPWDEWDMARRTSWRECGPLIPDRMIKGRISYKRKSDKIPLSARLTNGWEILFYSGNAKPPRGLKAHLVWFDEEILGADEWYLEAMARLTDHMGLFIWSATPQTGTQKLYDLYLDGQRQIGEGGKKRSENFRMRLDDNIYLPKEARERTKERYANDPDAYAMRIDGEFVLMKDVVYPEFKPDGVHGIESAPIPWSWTKYAVIDPGYKHTACLFAAIPEPPAPYQIILYDEIYLENCDAARLAKAIADKNHESWLQAIIIDPSAERHSDETGNSLSNAVWRELKAAGVHPVVGRLIRADNSKDAGLEKVRSCLRLQLNGKPTLQVMKGKLPFFVWELSKYRYIKRGYEFVTVDRNDHLMDCLRYLCMYNPSWVPSPGSTPSNVFDLQESLRRYFASVGGTTILGGGEKPRGVMGYGDW